MSEYTVREELKPSGLDGISDDQINDHWGLYKGYVTQSNALHKELEEMRAAGKTGTLAYADRRRRFGFEYNGMVLHEYYFAQLKPGSNIDQAPHFKAAVAEQFGSAEAWHEDLMAAAKSRAIGWAICYYDGTTGQINNHFVQLHEDGNIGGFVPLVVVDVWEHAYMVDWKALGRPDYLAALHKNIHWPVVEARFQAAKSGQIFKRF
ncbi:MAG: superoxide dismutase [Acidithiobacillus sp.]|uniref:superoxide dismutase n=1 Tax=Acidithiobacillus sp. TaxID=1872118 RepID=UPI0025C5C9A4|nr:Fe-Mn family superoxide dismutase [Acidithiobacillus sp.]